MVIRKMEPAPVIVEFKPRYILGQALPKIASGKPKLIKAR